MSERKSTSKANQKVASQEERLQSWREHFNNRLRNPPDITDKPILKIIHGQLDI